MFTTQNTQEKPYKKDLYYLGGVRNEEKCT